MMSDEEITCEIRYRLDPDRIDDFKLYAQTWTMLIERHGGTHHGYYIPRHSPAGAAMSFQGVGSAGADDVAVAMFSFADEAAYLRYRENVGRDPDGIAANELYRERPPFRSYERVFLRRI